MKWSVLKEWVDCCHALGMWHPMQPLAGSTGHVVLTSLETLFCRGGFACDGAAEGGA